MDRLTRDQVAMFATAEQSQLHAEVLTAGAAHSDACYEYALAKVRREPAGLIVAGRAMAAASGRLIHAWEAVIGAYDEKEGK